MKKISDGLVVLALVIFSLALRLWGAADMREGMLDERSHVETAYNYVQKGIMVPDRWEHPPLKHLLLYANLKLAGGETPYGWRIRNIIFGSLTAWLMFLLGREIVSARAGLMAALLLILDPLHVLLSRTTFEEIPAVFFMLTGIYLTIRHLKGGIQSPAPAGLFFGLAVATKWYCAPALASAFAFSIYSSLRSGKSVSSAMYTYITAFVILPLGIYALAFYSWFGRGYDFEEFIRMQIEAFHGLKESKAELFHPALLSSASPALEWFISPLVFVFYSQTLDGMGRFLFFMNNPPLWILSFPAVFYAVYVAREKRDVVLAFICATFFLAFFQFLPVKRPIFLYSAMIVLPLAYLATAFSATDLISKMKRQKEAYVAALASIVLWGLYLYPLATAKEVPTAIYSPLLAVAKFIGK